MSVKLLSFDLDDTLWPCVPTILAAEKKQYLWMQQNVPQITQRLSIDELRQRRFDFLELHPEFSHDLSALRIESFKALADEFKLDKSWVNPAFQVYFDARQEVTLFDDVETTLDSLHRQYRLVAVTNGNADVAKTGIGDWFEFAVTAAEVGHMKPHPAVFQALLSLSKCSVSEVLHIGDHQEHDVFAAKQAGIRSVWLNRNASEWQREDCQADFQISSLLELPELLCNI